MIRLKNVSTGLVVEAPTGFSWTNVIFGFFVPLFRGMYGYAAVCFLANLVTIGFAALVFPFLINKHHVKFLMEKGYVPHSGEDVLKLREMGFSYAPVQDTTPAKAA